MDLVWKESLDGPQIKAEKIRRIAIFVFDNPPLDLQAGLHISGLFELYLLRTSLYKIAGRGEATPLRRADRRSAMLLGLQYFSTQ